MHHGREKAVMSLVDRHALEMLPPFYLQPIVFLKQLNLVHILLRQNRTSYIYNTSGWFLILDRFAKYLPLPINIEIEVILIELPFDIRISPQSTNPSARCIDHHDVKFFFHIFHFRLAQMDLAICQPGPRDSFFCIVQGPFSDVMQENLSSVFQERAESLSFAPGPSTEI